MLITRHRRFTRGNMNMAEVNIDDLIALENELQKFRDSLPGSDIRDPDFVASMRETLNEEPEFRSDALEEKEDKELEEWEE